MNTGLRYLAGMMVAAACAFTATVRATPANGFVGATVAMGRLDEFSVNLHTDPADIWQSRQKTQGQSDLYVQSNVWAVGGSTGWHSHPGHSLIIITAGTVTNYEGNDPTCAPHVYSAGMSFVDEGGDHVHLVRNEGSVEARGYAVQLIPAQALRRIDEPPPGNCPF